MEKYSARNSDLMTQGYKHLRECIKPAIIHGKLIWDAAWLSWNGAAAAQHSTLCGGGNMEVLYPGPGSGAVSLPFLAQSPT